MTKIKSSWILALGLLIPATLQAQQDPALIGEGAQVYAANCGRCHNARSSIERTDAQWAIIVHHMRARANLTRSQAEAVLAYLQATNLPEGSAVAASSSDNPPSDLALRIPSPNVVLPGSLRIALLQRALRRSNARTREGQDPGGR